MKNFLRVGSLTAEKSNPYFCQGMVTDQIDSCIPLQVSHADVSPRPSRLEKPRTELNNFSLFKLVI